MICIINWQLSPHKIRSRLTGHGISFEPSFYTQHENIYNHEFMNKIWISLDSFWFPRIKGKCLSTAKEFLKLLSKQFSPLHPLFGKIAFVNQEYRTFYWEVKQRFEDYGCNDEWNCDLSTNILKAFGEKLFKINSHKIYIVVKICVLDVENFHQLVVLMNDVCAGWWVLSACAPKPLCNSISFQMTTREIYPSAWNWPS